MKYEKNRSKSFLSRSSVRTLQVAKLRQTFGLTLQQAAMLAALVYGEARE